MRRSVVEEGKGGRFQLFEIIFFIYFGGMVVCTVLGGFEGGVLF